MGCFGESDAIAALAPGTFRRFASRLEIYTRVCVTLCLVLVEFKQNLVIVLLATINATVMQQKEANHGNIYFAKEKIYLIFALNTVRKTTHGVTTWGPHDFSERLQIQAQNYTWAYFRAHAMGVGVWVMVSMDFISLVWIVWLDV